MSTVSCALCVRAFLLRRSIACAATNVGPLPVCGAHVDEAFRMYMDAFVAAMPGVLAAAADSLDRVTAAVGERVDDAQQETAETTP